MVCVMSRTHNYATNQTCRHTTWKNRTDLAHMTNCTYKTTQHNTTQPYNFHHLLRVIYCARYASFAARLPIVSNTCLNSTIYPTLCNLAFSSPLLFYIYLAICIHVEASQRSQVIPMCLAKCCKPWGHKQWAIERNAAAILDCLCRLRLCRRIYIRGYPCLSCLLLVPCNWAQMLN